MKPMAYIGIILKQGVFRLAVRRAGQVQTSASFPSDARGTERLKRYVAGMPGPARLAIAVGAATLGVAFALGEPPEREIFLVSTLLADDPAELASFAARPV